MMVSRRRSILETTTAAVAASAIAVGATLLSFPASDPADQVPALPIAIAGSISSALNPDNLERAVRDTTKDVVAIEYVDPSTGAPRAWMEFPRSTFELMPRMRAEIRTSAGHRWFTPDGPPIPAEGDTLFWTWRERVAGVDTLRVKYRGTMYAADGRFDARVERVD